MNEFDPTKREHISLEPLHRFHSDTLYVTSFADLYVSVTRYLTEEFGVSDETVYRMLPQDSDIMPTPELFENNPGLAAEQARLMLIKLALPIAEDIIEDENKFKEWTVKTARVALNIGREGHEVDSCLNAEGDISKYSCPESIECPIRMTTNKLIVESAHFDFNSPDYHESMATRKISRTLSKLEAAYELNLITEKEANFLANSYVARCKSHELPVAKPEDN